MSWLKLSGEVASLLAEGFAKRPRQVLGEFLDQPLTVPLPILSALLLLYDLPADVPVGRHHLRVH